MDDNILAADEILKQFGNFESLRLENILGSNDDDDDAPNLIHPSPYYTIDALPSHLMNDGHLNILSLNAQSINSKFDSKLALLDIAQNQNVNFHIICIQESWLKEGSDMFLFQIDGYQCISQGTQCSAHGGLVTYIESSLSCSKINIENRSSIWEGLFVSVKDDYSEKEFVIGNIYRPPYNNNNEDNINTFISELNPIIGKLNDSNRNIIIAAHFNINLLHINMCNKEHLGNFLDMMLGYSLFPKITHPTTIRRKQLFSHW